MAVKFKSRKEDFGPRGHLTDYLPTYLTWTNVDIRLTTYLPHLVHVVCERPLGQIIFDLTIDLEISYLGLVFVILENDV